MGTGSSKIRYANIINVLQDLLDSQNLNSINIMEIGIWRGGRSRDFIASAKNKGIAEVHFWGFDLFKEGWNKFINKLEIGKSDPPYSRKAIKNIIVNQKGIPHLIAGDTNETLIKNKDIIPKMDFIFIDGGHSIDTINNDWKFCKNLMLDHTVVVFDDYYPENQNEGCKSTIDAIKQDNKYEVEIIGQGDIRIAKVVFSKN